MDAFTEKAVSIQQVSLSHGLLPPKFEVLKEVNLNVNAGIIYGLLGPSGCGKTTLLKCVVGRTFPDFGVIKVFGETPGLINSKVPGSGVGYMPQELALFRMLTIAETLDYFGCLHHMTAKAVNRRIDFLLDFLNLPSKENQIKDLSGGQQRRVSFAVAMLHEPPLLILDEPTAGVDPLLRENIWEYLVQLCSSKKVTVIITTHYIEEARQAHKIGLMRNGKILLEGAPTTLLERHNLATLEDVYLKIFRNDDNVNLQNTIQRVPDGKKSILDINNHKSSHIYSQAVNTPAIKPGLREYFAFLSPMHIKGLVRKNFIRMRRNTILLIFQFLLPVIALCTFCMVVVGEPKQITVAVFNEDFYFGSQFLMQLSNVSVKQVPINSLDEGIALVTNGDAAAVIHIWKNFTNALWLRFTSYETVPDVITQTGSIHLRQDFTNQQISFFLLKFLNEAALRFNEATLTNVKRFPQLIYTVFEIHEPIYGDKENPYISEFLVLGLLICILNLMAISLTSLSFILDKKDGLLDRSYVSGVTSLEIMCGHMITQICVGLGQVTLVLLFAIYVFNFQYIGSMWIYVLIIILQTIQGMTFGFFISIVCTKVSSAMMLALTISFIALIFSGSAWPLAATSDYIRALANLMPQTLAVESARWVLLRSRNLLWTPVWSGLLSTGLWIIFYLLMSIIILRFK